MFVKLNVIANENEVVCLLRFLRYR